MIIIVRSSYPTNSDLYTCIATRNRGRVQVHIDHVTPFESRPLPFRMRLPNSGKRVFSLASSLARSIS